MRVLLDTNIIIHREASSPPRPEIGVVFRWLDQLNHEKYIHPKSIAEIEEHKDIKTVAAFKAKISSYRELRTTAPDTEEIRAIRAKFDTNDNDETDTDLIREVFSNRVDALLTEDRKIHTKADALGISERVFTIDDYLEKVTAENPGLADYSVLSVKKDYFGNIDVTDSFFDSFREDYKEFDVWFNRKANETAYVCRADNNEIIAFLYIKVEECSETYPDIEPSFSSLRRLKIGTLKVASNGYKLGERFLKIVFDNALRYSVDQIYVTLFEHTLELQKLIALLSDWGFIKYGRKTSNNGFELVMLRDFCPNADINNPRLTYPYISSSARKYLVPIYPEYHTELFPDSILKTESPLDYIESKPNRNAIRKVYISRSIERDLRPGDVIVFYRTKERGKSAYYSSVASTIGVIQELRLEVESESHFLKLCRKRSVFSDDVLRKHWNWNTRLRPFVVYFLYVYSFPKRMTLKALIEAGVIASSSDAPRGFTQISNDQFNKIMEGSKADGRIIVD